MSAVVTIRYCPCLKGTMSRVRDMLLAEGFRVHLRPVLRPGVLQVSTEGEEVWSWALWRRRIPDQKNLAQMVLAKGSNPSLGA